MKNIFDWARGRPVPDTTLASEEAIESGELNDDIPVPDICSDTTADGDTATMPALRIIGVPSDTEVDSFDPYDTAVLVED